MSGMKQLWLILCALTKNKLRFDESASTGKKVGLICLFAFAYVMIEVVVIMMSVMMSDAFSVMDGMRQYFYFIILIVAAAVVLIFGVVHLIATLYLAKDTDFYSALPVKPWVVFAAKTLFVYLFESAIVAAVALPAMIVYGVSSKVGAAYYLISILCLPIIPALPLVVAAIIAVPIMYIASKLRNRNIIPIIFYCLLFGGMFAMYIVMMLKMSALTDIEEVTTEQIMSVVRFVNVVGYILYPYTALSSAAFNFDTFGLGGAASTALSIVIFVGISVALLALLFLLGRFMYSQAAKANNQTAYSRVKKGEYKHATKFGALLRREYLLALRTPTTMFQCYFTMLFPIIFAVIFSLMFKNMSSAYMLNESLDLSYVSVMVFSTIFMMMPVVSNAAATSFSREGVGIEALKSMPIDAKTIVKAKVTAWAVIGMPIGVIAAVIVNIFMFDLLQLFLSIFAFLLLPFVYIVFGVLWDMSSPKLVWTDPLQAIKHNTHSTVAQFIGIGAGMVVFILSYIFMFYTQLSGSAVVAVIWSAIYGIGLIFLIVDILLYKRIDLYYNRMSV